MKISYFLSYFVLIYLVACTPAKEKVKQDSVDDDFMVSIEEGPSEDTHFLLVTKSGVKKKYYAKDFAQYYQDNKSFFDSADNAVAGLAASFLRIYDVQYDLVTDPSTFAADFDDRYNKQVEIDKVEGAAAPGEVRITSFEKKDMTKLQAPKLENGELVFYAEHNDQQRVFKFTVSLDPKKPFNPKIEAY